jgi:hypothetical protein
MESPFLLLAYKYINIKCISHLTDKLDKNN